MNKLTALSPAILIVISGCAHVYALPSGAVAAVAGYYKKMSDVTAPQPMHFCEGKNSTFQETVDCVKVMVADSNGMKNSAEVKRYLLLMTDQISEGVKQGSIPEIEARGTLRQLYVNYERSLSGNSGKAQ